MLKFLGSPELLFQRGAVLLKGKASFLEVKLRISEIHLQQQQQQLHDISKEKMKNDN